MTKILTALTLVALLAGPALALTAQQEKMKTCNADAAQKQLKGDARKTFMKDCLGAGAEPQQKALTPQQQKMKDCNASATSQNLKGAPRKEFISNCLKKQ
ncbi:MAG TPA: PsiF family protein [Candidatus Dormibacteraeota bacterium]|nr:PsiF family protein [Candidatus Dormibacteraeota bacterium]